MLLAEQAGRFRSSLLLLVEFCHRDSPRQRVYQHCTRPDTEVLKNTVIVIQHWINEHTLKQRSSTHLRTDLLSCSSEWALFAPPSSRLWPPASRESRPVGPPADSQEGWPDCRLPDWGTEWRSEPTRAQWPRRTEPRCAPEYLQERRQTQTGIIQPLCPGYLKIHIIYCSFYPPRLAWILNVRLWNY